MTMESRLLRVGFLTAVLSVAVVLPGAGQEGNATPPAGPITAEEEEDLPPDLSPPEVGVDEERLRDLIRLELESPKIVPKDEGTADQGRLLDLFNLAIAVQLFLVTVVTFLGGVLTFLGYREWKSISDRAEEIATIADSAQQNAETVEQRLASVREGAERISQVQASALEIQSRAIEAFDGLELDSFEAVVGERPPSDPELLAKIDDLDTVLTALFHLKFLPGREAASRAFIKLGRFWRRQLDFARSMERMRMAGELAPEELRPLVEAQTAVTLNNWAGWLKYGTLGDEKRQRGVPELLLAQASEKLDKVAESASIERMDLLYLRGTILHFQEQFGRAVETFRRALHVAEEPQTGESLVETNREVIRYNLAASLSRAGELAESLSELKLLPLVKRRDAQTDPDFQTLKEDGSLGTEFLLATREE